MEYEDLTKAVMFYLALIACVVIILFAACVAAVSQEGVTTEHRHPDKDMALHEKFYSTWMRPDNPTLSCCSNHDCYPTEARRVNGHWEALRREDKQWIKIPDSKVERNRDMPDAQAHLCAVSPNEMYYTEIPESNVYCFGAGGGT